MVSCTSPSSLHDSSTDNSSENEYSKPLLSEEEENKWRSIHNVLVDKIKQKVQAAKKSRFQGFFSPRSLNNTINKVRFADFKISKRERLRSLDVERDAFSVNVSKNAQEKHLDPLSNEIKFKLKHKEVIDSIIRTRDHNRRALSPNMNPKKERLAQIIYLLSLTH